MSRTLREVRVDTERKRVEIGRKRERTERARREDRECQKNHKKGASLSLVRNFEKIKTEA